MKSVQCPPIIEQTTVTIALSHKVIAATRFLGSQAFHPALTVAVLRILDVLARVEERSAIKAIVHIPGVRDIVPLNDSQEAVVLFHTFLTGIWSAALSFILSRLLTQQDCDLLV